MANAGVYRTLGASNHSDNDREENDLYCTHPDAIKTLIKLEQLPNPIWEVCDGLGHISDTLIERGYNVRRSDLFTRGRDIEQLDFLKSNETWNGTIVTNPPYSDAIAFVRKAMQTVTDGNKVCMWLRILFLESQLRYKLFKEFPPIRVWVSSRRIPCGMNGEFGASAQGYAWFVWEKGYKGKTELGWFL